MGAESVTSLSAMGEILRCHDPDRFFCALFAPPLRRETLFVLYAFNHELARAREAVREPVMALARLAFWRGVVEGKPERHEIALALAAELGSGRIERRFLLEMLEAREREAAPMMPDQTAFRAYLWGSAGALAAAAGAALGAPGADLGRIYRVGAAYGAAGVLRNRLAHAAAGRSLLPADLLAAHGIEPANAESLRLRPVIATIAAEAKTWLAEAAGPWPASWRSAALPAVLARRDLRRPEAVRQRRLADRLAVAYAAVSGRL